MKYRQAGARIKPVAADRASKWSMRLRSSTVSMVGRDGDSAHAVISSGRLNRFGCAPIPREMRVCPTCSREFMMSQWLCPHDGSVLEDKLPPEERLCGKTHWPGNTGSRASSVRVATHVMLGKPVALKLIRPEIVTSPEVVRRFQREARAASLLPPRPPG